MVSDETLNLKNEGDPTRKSIYGMILPELTEPFH